MIPQALLSRDPVTSKEFILASELYEREPYSPAARERLIAAYVAARDVLCNPRASKDKALAEHWEKRTADRLANEEIKKRADEDLRKKAKRDYCKKRYAKIKATKERKRLEQASRGKRVSQNTPVWVDRAEIKAIYAKAREMRRNGTDVHVDHIIPLNGRLVSGLHVHGNLRIIDASENMSKGARYEVSA